MQTYINVEISIVNIELMRSLLEVEVSNTVVPNPVVIDQAESGSRNSLFDELRGSAYSICTLEHGHGHRRVLRNRRSIYILGQSRET